MKKYKVYQDLVLKIIELYRSARKPTYFDKRISRGRSRPISSFVEDLFAKFLVDNTKCDQIFIDQPITVTGYKKTPYPDLLLVKGNRIIGTCDIKMDMGWNRDGLFALCKKSYDLVRKIKGKKCKITSGTDKKTFYFTIDNKLIHNIIIVSNKNTNADKLEQQKKKSLIFNPQVNVFVLTNGKHLNSYNISKKKLLEEIIKEKGINYEEFNRLVDIFT